MEEQARQQNAKDCEVYANEIIKEVTAAFRIKNKPDAEHWFIPYDFHDLEWTKKNFIRITSGSRYGDYFAKQSKVDFKYTREDSFHTNTEHSDSNVYFINAHVSGMEIKDHVCHELMHGLLSQNDVSMPYSEEELATDTFSFLMLKREGYKGEDILRLFLSRYEDHPRETSLSKEIHFPHSYPSLAYMQEIYALADTVKPDTPLRGIYDKTVRFVKTCDKRKIAVWEQICDNVQFMVREGESIPTILNAVRNAVDPATRRIGTDMYAILPHAERVKATPPRCNPFAGEEELLSSHRKKQHDAFDKAFAECMRQNSSRPLYEKAADQLSAILQGHGFGYAADALAFTASRWHDFPAERRAQELRRKFDAYLDNPRHDSMDGVDMVAQAFGNVRYRQDPDYQSLSKGGRLGKERAIARESVPDTEMNLIAIPMEHLERHHPDLLPDMTAIKTDKYLQYQSFRKPYTRH